MIDGRLFGRFIVKLGIWYKVRYRRFQRGRFTYLWLLEVNFYRLKVFCMVSRMKMMFKFWLKAEIRFSCYNWKKCIEEIWNLLSFPFKNAVVWRYKNTFRAKSLKRKEKFSFAFKAASQSLTRIASKETAKKMCIYIEARGISVSQPFLNCDTNRIRTEFRLYFTSKNC